MSENAAGATPSREAIAFVVHYPYVDSLACFREPIKLLADAGWDIDLYATLSPVHPPPVYYRANVRLIPIEITRAGVVRMMWQLARRRPKYRWILTVPQWALHYSVMAARWAGIPVGYISDEIFAERELTTEVQRAWKQRERRAHQRCDFTIALSPERGDWIRQENKLGPDHKMFVVPNAAPGPPRRLRSRFYRDTLGIADDRRVLLHAGGFGWRLARELATQAASWNGRWAMVFQARMKDVSIGGGKGPRLYFSDTVLPSDLLDYAVSSADVGIALYEDKKVNDALMGTASGKLAMYLQNVVPVITTNLPCFGWVKETGCGLLIDSVAEAQGAAERIMADYGRYCANAGRAFEEIFDLRKTFAPVQAYLEGQPSLLAAKQDPSG